MLKKYLIGTLAILAVGFALTVSAADFGTTTLRVGSKGEAVKAVQTLVGATVDGSFGPMTAAKVKAWQASNGLTADGVFGAMSKAKANAGSTVVTSSGCPAGALFNSLTGASCTTTTTLPAGCTAGAAFSSTTGAACVAGTTPVVGTLTGGAGDIGVDEISTDIESKIVEGQADVKNLGFKVEAKDSDIKVTNFKVTLTHATAGSTYLDRYVSNVSVWMNGSKVATIAASDFSRDSAGVYSKSIALDNAIVKEGTSNKATFYIATTGISNIDSGTDMNATWTINADNFRFQDGTGVILTYNTPSATPITSAALDVTDIAASGDVKLVISKDTSVSPAAQNVKVSSTGSTIVPLLTLKMKNTGADMSFDTLNIAIASDANLNTVLGDLVLREGTTSTGTEVASSSTFNANGAQTVAFSLDEIYTLPADTTKTFTIWANINDIDNFSQGKYLTASYSDSVFEVITTRTAVTETGSAVGDAQTFYSEGVNASNFTSSVVTTTDSGVTKKQTYTVSYKLTAFGNTYYIPKGILRGGAANDDTNGMGYLVETSAGTTATDANVPSTNSSLTSNASTVGTMFEIPDGETKTFTATIEITDAGDAPGFYHIQLLNAQYDTESTDDNDTSDALYTFAPAQNFETADTKVD